MEDNNDVLVEEFEELDVYSRDMSTDSNGEREKNKTRSATFPPVLRINVGGHKFVTRLSTIRKDPDSMLAAMFSGRHKVDMDSDGHYFIDSNGIFFSHILEFLRTNILPPTDVVTGVYREACYFNIKTLITSLETKAPVAKLKIKQSLRESFPNYIDFKSKIINAAIQKASTGQLPEVSVFAFCEIFEPSALHFRKDHPCPANEADVEIGPWSSGTTELNLMSCLERDLHEDGFTIQPIDKRRRCTYYHGQNCQRYIFKIVFNFDDD